VRTLCVRDRLRHGTSSCGDSARNSSSAGRCGSENQCPERLRDISAARICVILCPHQPVASSSSWPVLVARDLSASLFDLGGACPAQIGRRGSVSRGLLGGGDGAVRAIVGEAMRPEEDGDRAIGIFVNADDGPDEDREATCAGAGGGSSRSNCRGSAARDGGAASRRRRGARSRRQRGRTCCSVGTRAFVEYLCTNVLPYSPLAETSPNRTHLEILGHPVRAFRRHSFPTGLSEPRRSPRTALDERSRKNRGIWRVLVSCKGFVISRSAVQIRASAPALSMY
jgi:hypothetical protein